MVNQQATATSAVGICVPGGGGISAESPPHWDESSGEVPQLAEARAMPFVCPARPGPLPAHSSSGILLGEGLAMLTVGGASSAFRARLASISQERLKSGTPVARADL